MNVTKDILAEGNGPVPQSGQTITVHCTGFLENGQKFWSTKDPGQREFSFKLGVGQVIRGWDIGFASMKVGEVARLTIPGPLAYGARGFPAWGIGPNATLIFEVEILSASKYLT